MTGIKASVVRGAAHTMTEVEIGGSELGFGLGSVRASRTAARRHLESAPIDLEAVFSDQPPSFASSRASILNWASDLGCSPAVWPYLDFDGLPVWSSAFAEALSARVNEMGGMGTMRMRLARLVRAVIERRHEAAAGQKYVSRAHLREALNKVRLAWLANCAGNGGLAASLEFWAADLIQLARANALLRSDFRVTLVDEVLASAGRNVQQKVNASGGRVRKIDSDDLKTQLVKMREAGYTKRRANSAIRKRYASTASSTTISGALNDAHRELGDWSNRDAG